MNYIKNILIVAACLMLPQLASGQSSGLKVMSYNIRISSASDGTNSWMYRYPMTLEMLEDINPDVFGLQEALVDQVAFLDEFADAYDRVGVGADDGRRKGGYTAVYWNKKTVKMLKWGVFWLSETPEEPSMGWDAECFRTATWAILKDKRTGARFCFVNTHLDHVGKQARQKSVELILDRLSTINPEGLPVVLTGDFNMKPDDKALEGLDARMKNARKIAAQTDSHNTFNDWGKASKDMVIDHIYISGFSACPEYRTVVKKYGGRTFISDHYPILVRLIF